MPTVPYVYSLPVTPIQKRDKASGDDGVGPIRLGKCHRKDTPQREGFPCYKWFWMVPYGASDGPDALALPHIECMCGGSYPTVPKGGIGEESLFRREIKVDRRHDYGEMAAIILGIFVFTAICLGLAYSRRTSQLREAKSRRNTDAG